MCPTATLEKANVDASGDGIRDIVVQIDDAPGSGARLAFAAAFARRHGAHLVALLVQLAPQMPGRVRAEVGELVLDAWRREAAGKAQAMAGTVAAAGRAEGIDIEFRAVEGFADELLMAHARHADLTVLGQAAGDAADEQTRTIEALLFGSGRPILLLPSVGTYRTGLRHILCAWNGSREAARAIADAMPLLLALERLSPLERAAFTLRPNPRSETSASIESATQSRKMPVWLPAPEN